MRQTNLFNRQQTVLGVAALVLNLTLVLWLLTAQPIELSQVRDQATITFGVSQNAVLFAGDCVNAYWDVQGISEVYFENQPTVGNAQSLYCVDGGHPSLRIVYTDGSEERFDLPVRVNAIHPFTYLLLVSAAVSWLGVVRAGRPDSPFARLALRVRAYAASPYVGVGLLVLIGAALRIPAALDRGLVLDEAVLYHISNVEILTLMERNALWNSAPPLYALLVSMSLQIGQVELFVRLWSLTAGILAIPMIYAVARQYCSHVGALFSASIAAVSLSAIYYSHYAREYSFAVLLSAAMIYLANRWSDQPVSRLAWALTILGCISLLMNYGLVIVLAVVLTQLLMISRKDAGRLRLLLRVVVIWVLAAVFVYFVSFRTQMEPGGFASDSYLASFYWDGDLNYLMPFALETTLQIIRAGYGEGIFGLSVETDAFSVLTLFGLAAAMTTRLRSSRFLLLMPFAATFLLYLLALYPYTSGRQTAFLYVLLFVFCGLAFDHGLKSLRPVGLRYGTMIAVGVLLAVSGIQNYHAYASHAGFDNVREAVSVWREERQPGDETVVAGYAAQIFTYYVPDDEIAEGTVQFIPDVHGSSALAATDTSNGSEVRTWVISVGEDWLEASAFADDWQVVHHRSFNNIYLTLLSMNQPT